MQDLREKGIKLAAMDVSKEESVAGAVKEILGAAGRVDLLVCNAGTLPPCLIFAKCIATTVGSCHIVRMPMPDPRSDLQAQHRIIWAEIQHGGAVKVQI